jgi:uncharacterized protein (DUF2132 family)
MNKEQPNNPLHGITLKEVVERLVKYYGWEQLGIIIEIGCFNYKPSVTSSLRFLRSTLWARKKVERLYTAMQEEIEQSDMSLSIDGNKYNPRQNKLSQDSESKEYQNPQEPKEEETLQEPKAPEESKEPKKPKDQEQQAPQEPKEIQPSKFSYRKGKSSSDKE